MTAFSLKLLAIITMMIDHIGLFFFPNVLEFRIIGRLSFPLFAWLIANGAYYTHNIGTYMGRLFVFALVSQVPFLLANQQRDSSYFGLNVLFTLFFGLVAVWIFKSTKNNLLGFCATFLLATGAQLLMTDYGAFGVVSIVFFYLFFNNLTYVFISQSLLVFAAVFFLQIWNLIPLGLFAILFIALYNKKAGPKAQYLFYVFYPLQYIIIYLVQRLL